MINAIDGANDIDANPMKNGLEGSMAENPSCATW
jgi:hypothetical protein